MIAAIVTDASARPNAGDKTTAKANHPPRQACHCAAFRRLYFLSYRLPARSTVFRALILICLALAMPVPAGSAEGEPLRSILLVASTKITDRHFGRSVVLVTHEAQGGPLGLILNRPTDLSLHEVFEGVQGLDSQRDRVFFGGPVSVQMLIFVFRAEGKAPEGIEVLPGVRIGFEPKVLDRLLRREQPTRGLRVFAGYAGWAPGQLEEEIARGDWHLLQAEADIVFSEHPESLWTELIRRASLESASNAEPPSAIVDAAGRLRLRHPAKPENAVWH